ncbi:unnamed protein product [Haemonchus placei]|uniref:Uncharacterized protein n=1 Tax=Haemonchus placei TaxID=6290 RepID=A0A0N4WMP1_HAEPC|nr:unnamed protein product [Haemonchus placei]
MPTGMMLIIEPVSTIAGTLKSNTLASTVIEHPTKGVSSLLHEPHFTPRLRAPLIIDDIRRR